MHVLHVRVYICTYTWGHAPGVITIEHQSKTLKDPDLQPFHVL